jgi:pimeloyl-ACP methyl ester carboxylesterase
MAPKTIVFVHGMFMTPLCWEHWLTRFAERGYRCLAPAWPGRDRPVAELRAHSDPELGRLTLNDVVAHVGSTVAALAQKPIVIGHSTGGLVAQILVNRDAVAAGVAIDSAPPESVFTAKWSFLRAHGSLTGPFADPRRPKTMTFEEFQYAFANMLPIEAQRAAFDRYVVPGSRMLARRARGAVARIDFAKPHPPLLVTAGVQDRVFPASLNFNNFARYRQRGAITDFRAFDGRDHLVIAEPGWEEVADFVANWLEKLKA